MLNLGQERKEFRKVIFQKISSYKAKI